jgi:hypothetical protein
MDQCGKTRGVERDVLFRPHEENVFSYGCLSLVGS